MPKGVPNRRYTPEFKKLVVETMQNRSRCGFVEAALRRHGIITSKLPLARPRVCKAHAPVLAHRALKTLNHAKPQQVRFC